jgi:hypothetical protein
MTAHLQRFIDRVQGLEARGAKDFVIPMADARGVAADLTRILLELNDFKKQAVTPAEDQVIEVKMSGGAF